MEDDEYGEWMKAAVMASKDNEKKRLLKEQIKNQQTIMLNKNTKPTKKKSLNNNINMYDIAADIFSALPKNPDTFKRIKLEETAIASWEKSCLELYPKRGKKVIGVKQENKEIVNKVNKVTVKQQPLIKVIKQGSLMITDIDLLIQMMEDSNGGQNNKKRGRKATFNKARSLCQMK